MLFKKHLKQKKIQPPSSTIWSFFCVVSKSFLFRDPIPLQDAGSYM